MTYTDGAAFRRALETRLLAQSRQSGVALVRLRKLVAFDRFLARLAIEQPGQWLLKGGVAMQLRLGSLARTTKDIDLLLALPHSEAYQALAHAARRDLGDWFAFTVEPARGPLPGIGEGGLRFPTTALLDGRVFESFHIDVGSGDPVVEAPETLTMPSLLAFSGITPAVVPCYPVSQHVAEKMHAYVRPHPTGANTRVRDLLDLVLLARNCSVDGEKLHAALQATFSARDFGPPPLSLPDPPADWRASFKLLCAQVGLDDLDLVEATVEVRRFLEPVLQEPVEGVWSPEQQIWVRAKRA
jgi:hypothetical protein